MKILAISDTEERYLWDDFQISNTADADLIISCGDLRAEYLEFLVTMTNLPLLYVPGNHDSVYAERPPGGCINIDDALVAHKGLKIAGLGGSMRYNNGEHQYTEQQMKKRMRRLSKRIRLAGGVDIIVTHAPPAGYGDLPDLPHRGFECYNKLISETSPRLMLHGHIHTAYQTNMKREKIHISGTRVVNCCGYTFVAV